MNNLKEKGISLYLAVVIMSILIAVISGIGTILFYQMNILKDMGDSVVAFYAADTGIERGLYDEAQCLVSSSSTCLSNNCRKDSNGDGFCDGVSLSYDKTNETVPTDQEKYEIKFIQSPNGFHSKGSFNLTTRTIEVTGDF